MSLQPTDLDVYLHKTPRPISALFPDYVWHRSRSEKKIFLTFDDGPTPGVTDFVLENLNKYSAKATFFCVGNNLEKYPDLVSRTLSQGHLIANHTHNHLKGSKTPVEKYIFDVQKCQETLISCTEKEHPGSELFRPPYGRMRRAQAKILLSKFKIIMWDVLSGDFDPGLSAEICLRKTIKSTRSGSIVVFHDSIKAEKKLRYVLPEYLNRFADESYSFETL